MGFQIIHWSYRNRLTIHLSKLDVLFLVDLIFCSTLKGTRFLEILKNGAGILLSLDAIQDFFNCHDVSRKTHNDYQKIRTDQRFRNVRLDFYAIILLTAVIVEPLFRASLCLESEVKKYKDVLEHAIEICELEDMDEKLDIMLDSKTYSPELHSFEKLDRLQQNVFAMTEDMSADDEERVKYILDLSSKILANSLKMANASIIEADLSEIRSGAVHHNNFAESSFSKLDYIERSRQNLSFLNKETLIMSQSNGFIEWFDSLEQERKSKLLDRSRQLVSTMITMVKTQQSLEDELRIDLERRETAEITRQRNRRASLKSELLDSLGGCIPHSQADYASELALFLEMNINLSERDFLRQLLQLKKLENDGARPAKMFTLSVKGKALSTENLRQKFFVLIE